MFTELTLNDREKYLKYYDSNIFSHSQYNFTTIYAWRRYLSTAFDIIDNNFCILNSPEGKRKFSPFPIGSGDPNVAINALVDTMGSECRIFNVTKQMYDKIENPERFIINEARYNFDYVYETSMLVSLSGKKLHSKKNHLNKFLATYPTYSYELINKKNLDDCIRLTEMWINKKYEKSSVKDAKYEYSSIMDILKNMDILECKGLVLYVEGKAVAYSVGEQVSHDTAIIHIEKADTLYDGSYAMINNLMCKNLFYDTTYINREEDMGLENLRKAKLSYRPHHLVEVMHLTLK